MATTTQAYPARRKGSASPRILVVDDDRDTVKTLSAVLQSEGYVVHSAYCGTDVLPLARMVRPDAVVLDISVPGMSGFAVAQELRLSFTDARRPLLIAISGVWSDASDQRIAMQVGFDHYLAKPCEMAALLRLLEPLRIADQ